MTLPPESPPPSPPPDPQQPYGAPYPAQPDPQLPYGTPYPAQPGYTGPPPSKARAGWSLGLAIFPSCITWVISIVLAITVLRDARDGRDHGQRMAKAALIIVGAWVVVAIIVVVVVAVTGAERDENGRVTEGGRASVLDLRVGDCLPRPDFDGEQRTLELVECSEPHRAEVYAVFDLDGEFTTRDEVGQLADASCFDRFEAFVGIKPRQSSLGVYDLIPPDAASFEQDPSVTCILVSDAEVTGTLEGSSR